jgi:hypothetical protein
MSTPDFSKIWGSNVSPENRYKFTDSAYLEGWSYIGSVPPAREAFDTLFRDIDTKMSYLNDELKNQSDSAKEHDANAAAHNAMATTVDDTLVPTSDTNTIRNLVSNLANRIKAATGAGGWKEAPAATLASLSKMFANLATGADVTWDGKKFTNHRLGITGLMDQNGYICFGPNCGNLIIQWGESTSPITFPIVFNILYAYEMLHYSSLKHKTIPLAGANDGTRLFFDLWNMQANDYDAAGTAIYIAVGK